MNIGFQTSGLSGFTRVAYLWRRHASAVLWIAMAALLPTACSDDAEQSVPQANGHTAVIYLNFKTGASKQAAEMNTSQSSETRAPLTRAIDENGINTVDVLSFKVDPADPTNIGETRSHTDGFQRNNAKCLDEKGISRFVPHSSI